MSELVISEKRITAIENDNLSDDDCDFVCEVFAKAMDEIAEVIKTDRPDIYSQIKID